jgi:large subunit ribosomal protein L7/L12
MSAIAEFGDKLAGLTLKEAVELKDYLKEKYGIEPVS